MALTPIFNKLQTKSREVNTIQDNISKSLNPIASQPLSSANLLQSVTLASGTNSINHKLGRNLLGWFPTRIRNTSVTLYDTQDTNPSPALTLNLVSSAAVVIDLIVF